ncbi:tyrosine-type recombinase/integrase [Afifella sp. H1R]|uniref:tyrosine-type recombinase/integrase n=1 Tax=Afifella sp. H1R TaxID=2908841 RepID=UPI001F3500EF|nr:tyrosine-type recombinase/integrase [Afifella sp. H1R]MCF1502956.1 tyrosine-type recombinase/integrase [Afifella sp. H1R]
MSVYRPKDRDGQPKSPYWHYEFRLGGRRFFGSTRQTSRREAVKVEAEARRRAARDIAAGRETDTSAIDLVFGRFWQEKGQHDASSDVTFYRLDALERGLTSVLRDRGRPPLVGEIDDEVLAAYVARRRGEPVRRPRRNGSVFERPRSPSDVNRDVQLLRRVLRRAKNVWKLAIDLPAWGEHLFVEPAERVVDMSAALEAEILAAMRPDFRPAMRWLVLSGLRLSNALPLDPRAVDFGERIVTARLKSRQPGGRLLVLPLTQPMLVLLANEIGRHPDAVFTYIAQSTRAASGARPAIIRGMRYPLRPETFYDEFKRAVRRCGHPELRPHDLRHVAGTRILRATGNLRMAAGQLGHTRVTTTQRYAHYLVDELRAAMTAAHVPGETADIPSPAATPLAGEDAGRFSAETPGKIPGEAAPAAPNPLPRRKKPA